MLRRERDRSLSHRRPLVIDGDGKKCVEPGESAGPASDGLEQVSPCVVRAYAWVIDALFTHPCGEALPRLHSRPAMVGVTARLSGWLAVEQQRLPGTRGQYTLYELGEVLADKIGYYPAGGPS